MIKLQQTHDTRKLQQTHNTPKRGGRLRLPGPPLVMCGHMSALRRQCLLLIIVCCSDAIRPNVRVWVQKPTTRELKGSEVVIWVKILKDEKALEIHEAGPTEACGKV